MTDTALAAIRLRGPNMAAARRPRSAHQQVAYEIGSAIVRGTYPPDAILPRETLLATRFGVSRSVIREALRTLVGKGLVVSRPRIGSRVTDRADWNLFDPDLIGWHLEGEPDERFMRDIVDIRLAVEPLAASLAAERRTPDDLARLRGDLERMAAARDRADFAAADLAYHVAVAAASRNPFIRSIGSVIEAALALVLKLSSPLDEARHRQSVADHAGIVDAIEAGDPERAATAMRLVVNVGARNMRVPTDAR